ncbi:MAG: carbohydrate-binding domain-containing protein [Trueperaceae bacterium]
MERRFAWLVLVLSLIVLLVACSSGETATSDVAINDDDILSIDEATINPGSAAADTIAAQGTPSTISDPNGLHGVAYKFLRNGDELKWEKLKAGTYNIYAWARGELYGAEAPKLTITIGSQALTQSFSTTSYVKTLFGQVTIKEGDQVSAKFINDAWGGTSTTDRNLVLSHIWCEPVSGGTPSPDDSTKINSVQTIIDDVTLPHDAKPLGVPEDYSWAQGPVIDEGKDYSSFKAFTAWGQLYEPTTGNPAVNTRVQLKNIKTYFLSKSDNTWYLLQSTADVDGAAYVEDFSNDESIPADIRTESEGVSVTAGDGYNFHFWPSNGRAEIDPNNIAGWFTTVQARLIVDDQNLPDDRAQAKFIMGMAGDYWISLDASWESDWSANSGIGVGRFKYLTADWQAFNFATFFQGDLDEEKLRQNPPPLE